MNGTTLNWLEKGDGTLILNFCYVTIGRGQFLSSGALQ